MTNKDFALIVESIQEKLKIDLKEIAERAAVNRSHLSTIVNSNEVYELKSKSLVLKKIKKAYPTYFSDETNTTNETNVPVEPKKNQPLELAGLNVTLEDHLNEIKRNRDETKQQNEFLQRMLEEGLKELKVSLDRQATKLLGIQSDLVARSEVALNSLARIQNPKKPPKLNEEADRISSQRQAVLPHTSNGKAGIDDE